MGTDVGSDAIWAEVGNESVEGGFPMIEPSRFEAVATVFLADVSVLEAGGVFEAQAS
jgi:hypothetical protein